MSEAGLVAMRYLDLEIRVSVSDRTAAEALQRAVPKTRHDHSARHRLDLVLTRAPPFFRLSGYGADRLTGDLSNALHAVLSVSGDAMMQAMPPGAVVAAATVDLPGGAMLLVGGEQSGLSTLAMALSVAGYDVGSDRYTILSGGVASPMPGRFSIWSSSLKLLAALPGAELWPVLKDTPSHHFRFVIDPTDVGRPWRVRARPVGAVILLEPNFGGRSRMRPIREVDMTRLVLHQSFALQAGRDALIREVCTAVASARCAVLELGTLLTAVEAIQTFIDRGAPRSGRISAGMR